jgi:hypothetical protein
MAKKARYYGVFCFRDTLSKRETNKETNWKLHIDLECSMTYVMDKLEQRSLLSRNACPDDRRVTHVTLTDEGYELMIENHAEIS